MLSKEAFSKDHETRNMVYKHITVYPGVSFTVLKDIFNISEGTLRYHLKYLERGERISSGLESGKRCYYPIQSEIIISKINGKKTNNKKLTTIQERMISIIQKNPGISQKELIKKSKLSRFTIIYNIRKFIDLGIVRKIDDNSTMYYEYISDELMKHEILKTLIYKFLRNEIDDETFHDLKMKLSVE